MSRRPNISAALRRRRALRVALGSRKFRWRALDHRGAYYKTIPRVVSSFEQAMQCCHAWLDRLDPDVDSWWFLIEELAFDESGLYSVVVDYKEYLIYRETLWEGFRSPFECLDRKAVCYG